MEGRRTELASVWVAIKLAQGKDLGTIVSPRIGNTFLCGGSRYYIVHHTLDRSQSRPSRSIVVGHVVATTTATAVVVSAWPRPVIAVELTNVPITPVCVVNGRKMLINRTDNGLDHLDHAPHIEQITI